MSQLFPDTSSVPSASARERGLGMVELIVVGVIVAILMSAAIIGFGGSRSAARSGEAAAAAAAYDSAIAKHMTDHANRLPTARDMMTTGGKWSGPRSMIQPNRPYIGALPSGVAEGRIGVAADCRPPTGATAQAWIAFCPETAPNYGIRLTTRRVNQPWSAGKVCWRGNTGRAPRCR